MPGQSNYNVKYILNLIIEQDFSSRMFHGGMDGVTWPYSPKPLNHMVMNKACYQQ